MKEDEVRMRVGMWMATGLLACCSGLGMAQMQMPMGGGQSVPMGAPMDPAKAQDAMLSLFEDEMTKLVQAMPADKFNFAPGAANFAAGQGAKFDGVRTFAQQVLHVTGANYYFFSTITGTKADAEMKALANVKTKEEILTALAASFAYGHKAVAMITPANAFETIDGVDGMHTRATVASFAVAHGFDHYGQLIEYLRMNGIVPPGSK